MRNDEDRGFWDLLWREALRAMALGWELAIPIFAGILLGHLVDRWLGTGHIFTLGLLMAGIMISYYNLARFIQRMAAHEKRREKKKEKETEEN